MFYETVPYLKQCEIYGRGRQATDGNITRRMGLACRLKKSTNKQSEYYEHLPFNNNNYTKTSNNNSKNSKANEPQLYIDKHISYSFYSLA
jgi:hypothetical protein